MPELKKKIDQIAELCDEFDLEFVELKDSDVSVKFGKYPQGRSQFLPEVAIESASVASRPKSSKVTPKAPLGTPVNSPTTGIFYSSPNPGSPNFVKIGEPVEAGQVIGLIEAMKVFNEITATMSGIVRQVVVENGQLVQPGDPLIYIG